MPDNVFDTRPSEHEGLFESYRQSEEDHFQEKLGEAIRLSLRAIRDGQWTGTADTVEGLTRAINLATLAQLWDASDGDIEPGGSSDKQLARDLLLSFLSHTDSVEARRAQIFRYLAAPDEEQRFEDCRLEFACLRRYSSAFPLIPRPETSRSHGGGYFLRLVAPGARPLGIVVDPGTSFLECFFRSPYGLADIDGIIVSHDHVDHASMLDPLLSALYEASQVSSAHSSRDIWIAGNDSIVKRLELAADRRYSRVARKKRGSPVLRARNLYALSDAADVAALSSALTQRLAEESTGLTVDVAAISTSGHVRGNKGHLDTGGHPALGILVKLTQSVPGCPPRSGSIFMAGDMPNALARAWRDGKTRHPRVKECLAADVVVAHASTTPVAELRREGAVGRNRPTQREVRDVVKRVERMWRRYAPKPGAGSEPDPSRRAGQDYLRRALTYAMWLGFKRDPRGAQEFVSPVRFNPRDRDAAAEASLEDWTPYVDHLYLRGLLDLARAAAKAPGALPRERVFLLGELSEELGSFRRRIAQGLNERVLPGAGASSRRMVAMTSDLGLRLRISLSEPQFQPSVDVACSTCELDNDACEEEHWHLPGAMREVCVKGENEGIFYNCAEHDPGRAERGQEAFLERFERFDVFGA